MQARALWKATDSPGIRLEKIGSQAGGLFRIPCKALVTIGVLCASLVDGSKAYAAGVNDVIYATTSTLPPNNEQQATYIGVAAGSGSDIAGNTNNTAVGYFAAMNTSGGYNTAFGESSGINVSGAGNNSLGDAAGLSISGLDNEAIGAFSQTSVTGSQNIGFGYSTGNRVTGTANTATGASSGRSVTGNNNLALGYSGGISVSGTGNAAVGGMAPGQNVTGNNNTAVGVSAGQSVTGSDNAAFGTAAGSVVSASRTTSIGYHAQALQNDTVAIGTNASASANNAVAIGSGAVNTMANTVQFGAAGTALKLTNVANGSNATDAVNYLQLRAVTTLEASDVANLQGQVTGLFSSLGTTNTSVSALSGMFASLTGASLSTPNTVYGQSAGFTLYGSGNTGVGIKSASSVTGNLNTLVGQSAGTGVSGSINSALGSSAGVNVSGNTNTAVGASAGQSVTGNANVAVGQNAGSSGTQIVATSSAKLQTVRFGVPTTQGVTPANLAVQGNNNIAVGTNAGLGNGSSVNDSVAIGTNTRAGASSAVAVGSNASANVAGAVALGSGSIANVPNTVSVGAPGSERRITNVAAGVNPTDAVNLNQLATATNALATQIQRQGVAADAGIAISMAQAEASEGNVAAGETAFGIGSGYYSGQTAFGIGLTSASKHAERVVHVATAMSPGFGNFGAQAGMQFKIGHAPENTTDTAMKMFIPDDRWAKIGFISVDESVPMHEYNALTKETRYRISLAQTTCKGQVIWHAYVDRLDANGIWKAVNALPAGAEFDSSPAALQETLTALAASVHFAQGHRDKITASGAGVRLLLAPVRARFVHK